MRSQKWMMWSTSASILLFGSTQFFPFRSILLDGQALYFQAKVHVLFTSTTQSQTGAGSSVDTTVIDLWRAALSVSVVVLLAAGVWLAVRRPGGAGPVLIAGGASSLIALAIWTLASPFPPDFGSTSVVTTEPFESSLTVSFGSGIWDDLDVGFYLFGLATLSAMVSLVWAVSSASRPVLWQSLPDSRDDKASADA